MEKLTINIKRCEECEYWKRDIYEYSTGYVDDTLGWCKRKCTLTNFADGCIDTTEIRGTEFWYALFDDSANCNVVYGLE